MDAREVVIHEVKRDRPPCAVRATAAMDCPVPDSSAADCVSDRTPTGRELSTGLQQPAVCYAFVLTTVTKHTV